MSLLLFDSVRMEATLPACLSRLAQLTSLVLCRMRGLRCEPGWARLPQLAQLHFEECEFAGDGEAALPGMNALVSLTSLSMDGCHHLRTFPASLWQLTQLRGIATASMWDLATVPRDKLPLAGIPAAAPCFASLMALSLPCYNLPAFPAGVLLMTRLTYLDFRHSCFELLPKGVSVLTALKELRLGRHPTVYKGIGGALDARALGSLAGCPSLHSLSFNNCSVAFSPSMQAAAAHPRLKRLELRMAFPAAGRSCQTFLAFVGSLQQQGREGVVSLNGFIVQGAGRQDSAKFRAALRAMHLPAAR